MHTWLPDGYAARIGTRLVLLSMVFVASAASAQVVHPIKITATTPGALSTADVETEVENGQTQKTRVLGGSTDKHVKSGLNSAQISKGGVESYPLDEFMYFMKGGLTLTSADGTVTEVKAGDMLYIPKGWKGTWDTKGYTKMYVVYDAEKAAD